MNINNVNSSNTPNYSYEFYTIHTSSNVNITTGLSDSSNSYVAFLNPPLKDVVQVSVLSCDFNGSTVNDSNVAYLCVDELISPFNHLAVVPYSNSFSTVPSSFSMAHNPILSVGVNPSDRTLYQQYQYSSQTQFVKPINKLDRLTISLRSPTGAFLNTLDKTTYISFRFTCLRENLRPAPPKKKEKVILNRTYGRS